MVDAYWGVTGPKWDQSPRGQMPNPLCPASGPVISELRWLLFQLETCNIHLSQTGSILCTQLSSRDFSDSSGSCRPYCNPGHTMQTLLTSSFQAFSCHRFLDLRKCLEPKRKKRCHLNTFSIHASTQSTNYGLLYILHFFLYQSFFFHHMAV